MQGSGEAALVCYNEAMRLDAKNAAANASRVEAHLATGDTSPARTDLLAAARIDSGNPLYLYKLACALYSQSNLPEALHFAEEAVRKDHARNGMYQAPGREPSRSPRGFAAAQSTNMQHQTHMTASETIASGLLLARCHRLQDSQKIYQSLCSSIRSSSLEQHLGKRMLLRASAMHADSIESSAVPTD